MSDGQYTAALHGLFWATNRLPDPQPHAEALKLADRLATGGESSGSGESLLRPIFASLRGHTTTQTVPVAALNPADHAALFPVELSAQAKQEAQRKSAQVLTTVKSQLQALNASGNPAQAVETALALLQEYAWCLPAGTPDVSLFDQARLIAALNTCLAADSCSEDWCKDATQQNEPVCLLVGGDLSGLQAFIYTLASEGAAKSLRARSFYVQLLTEALALAVLRELGLPLTNALYIGGGGFQLFAPRRAKDNLPDIAKDLTDRLLTLHNGALGLTLHWMELTTPGLKNFGATRETFGKELNHRKRRPFSQASLETLRAQIGQPISQGGDPLAFCRVTGEDGDTVERLNEDGSETYRAKFVSSLEEFGRQLPSATHIAYASVEKATAERATDWQQALRVFGFEFRVVGTQDGNQLQTISTDDFVRVWRLAPTARSDEGKRLASLGDSPHVVSYRPFAKLTPRAEGGIKTFDQLAKPAYGGFKRWGVLRMDVDNLGKLFQEGFANASPARIASLSFALRLFFEGYLPELARGDEKTNEFWTKQNLADYLYLQYSGGDDVFVVGAWDALPEFARRVREAFRTYTTGYPELTLSAGIALAEEKFPLYQAAEMADEAEHAAKAFEREGGRKKDAVSFLEQTLDWTELDSAQRRAYALANFIDHSQISRAVLQTILALRAQVARAQKNATGKVEYGRWTWLAAYQLTRAIQSIKKENDTAKMEIQNIQEVFLGAQAESMKLAGLAARWAQYLTRGG